MQSIKLRDYNILSDQVYDIDPKKGAKYMVNKNFHPKNISQSYKILDISRDGTYGSHHQYGAKNGMQAMTVAPVSKNGKVDYGHITIAYAGTNMADGADRATDFENIVTPLHVFKGDGDKQSQFTTANGYANYIQNKYKKKVPNVKFSVTGHSLGGSVALAVGGKYHLHTVAFNGPFPVYNLNPLQILYIKNHPEMFADYLNEDDFIGNYHNNWSLFKPHIIIRGKFQHYYKNGTDVSEFLREHQINFSNIDYVKTLKELKNKKLVLRNGKVINLPKEIMKAILDNHGIDSWFDKDGKFKFNKLGSLKESKIQSEFENEVYDADLQLSDALMAIKQGSKGAAGSGKEVYLDSVTAYAVQRAIKAHAHAGIKAIKSKINEGEDHLTHNWAQTLRAAQHVGRHLSSDAIYGALAVAFADKNHLNDKPISKLDQKKQELTPIKEDFDSFSNTFAQRIEKRIGDDQELAGWFKD